MSDSDDPKTRRTRSEFPEDDFEPTVPLRPRSGSGADAGAEETTDLTRDEPDPADRTLPSGGPSSGGPSSGGRSSGGSSSGTGSSSRGAGASSTRASSKPVRQGTVFGGRFEAVRALGKGGMGEVYLVRDRQIEDRLVALKLVLAKWSGNRQFRDLFFQEIRSAQEFVSPHVTQIRDCGQLPNKQLFFTMDYVDGESVSHLLRREKTLVPRHALEIARQVLLGLSSGHERGLIHRDVKPSNVMLAARAQKTSDNPHGVQVGLLDFGLAALTETLEVGRGPGTPHYMSPEQASGQRLDARSDLFAVGVLLYEMISGSRPFQGKTEQEITSSVIETDPLPLIQSLEGIKKPIKRILSKALQKEREKRFSSAAEFIEAIEKSTVFQAKEGAPGWVAGLAAATSVSTLVLGGLYVDSLRAQGDTEVKSFVGDTAIKQELVATKQQVTDLRGQLSNATAQRDAAVTARTNDKQASDELATQRIKQLGERQTRIEELEDELKLAQSSIGEQTDTRQDAEIESNRRVNESNEVVQLLLDELDGVLQLVGPSLDQYGAKLGPVASLFDRLVEDVRDGRSFRTSRIALARSNRTISATTPGFDYLERLEQLARDIDAFGAGTAGNQSFTALARLRERFDQESSPTAIAEFRAETIGDDESAGGRNRWLGVELLTAEELEGRLLDIVDSAKRDSSADSLVAPAETIGADDGSEPEAGSVAAVAEEKISNEELVSRKRRLAAWVEVKGLAKVTEALYGAQQSAQRADERIAALGAACTALGERLQAKSQQLDTVAQKRAAAIDGSQSLDAHTGQLIAFLEDFGVYSRPFATTLVQALVERCEAAAIQGDDLSPDGLRQLPVQLGTVAELVAGDSSAVYEVSDDRALDTLRWLTLAQSWYVTRPETAPSWEADFVRDHVAKPLATFASPWQRLLSFQMQLSTQLAALPGKASAKCVFTNNAKVGDSGWYVYGIEGGEVIKQKLRLDGASDLVTPRTPYPYNGTDLASGKFEWEGTELVALREISAGGARFETWTPPADDVRQRFVGSKGKAFQSMDRNRPLDLIVRAAYRGEWSPEDGYQCLVVTKNNSESWVHPILGVVRQKLALATTELVHVDH